MNRREQCAPRAPMTIVPAHPGFWFLDHFSGDGWPAAAETVVPGRFAIVAWGVLPPQYGWADVVPVTIRGVEAGDDAGTAILAPDGTVMDCRMNTRTFATVADWIRADTAWLNEEVGKQKREKEDAT